MSISKVLYDGWQAPARVLVIGIFAYLALLLLLRVSGKRTLSKMNAFDFIVTIALGSTLASALLSRDVALVDAVAAFALLIGLQFVVTWLSVRSKTISRLVKSEPTLLLYRGEFLSDAMRDERITEGEIYAAVRDHGARSLEDVQAVVLETTGQLSVITGDGPWPSTSPSSLSYVRNTPSDAGVMAGPGANGDSRR